MNILRWTATMMLALLITALCAEVRAQDDGGAAESAEAGGGGDAGKAVNAEDALRRYLALQKGMYAQLVSLEDKASEYQRHLSEIDVWMVQDRMRTMTQPEETPAPEPAPANQKGSKGREKKPKVAKQTVADRLQKDLPRLYSIYVREPTLCAEMDSILTAYVDAHLAELQSLVPILLSQYKTMDDAQRAETAKAIGTSMAATPKLRSVHNMMALCLYKQKTEIGRPVKYSPEKTWRRWYRVQTPLLAAWLRTEIEDE